MGGRGFPVSSRDTPSPAHPSPHALAMSEKTAPALSLVAYGEDEEEEEEDSGARSSDEDLLVPRKRVRVQKTEEGELCSK